MAVALAVGVSVGVDATVGTGVAVAEGSTGGGEAVQVGAGATVAAVLQADKMKAAARAIPVNFKNILLVTIIHTLSIKKIPFFVYRIIPPIRGQRIFPAFIECSNKRRINVPGT